MKLSGVGTFGCLAPLMLFSISFMEMDRLDFFFLFHFGSTLLNYILLEYYFIQVLKKNVRDGKLC